MHRYLFAAALWILAAFPAWAQKPIVSVDNQPKRMELSRDGRYLALLVDSEKPLKSDLLRIWDTKTGKEITKPELAFEGTGLFEFSPTEDLLLVGTRKTAAIEMFGLPDWKKIHVQRFDGVGVRFNTLKFEPGGKWIVRILNH